MDRCYEGMFCSCPNDWDHANNSFEFAAFVLYFLSGCLIVSGLLAIFCTPGWLGCSATIAPFILGWWDNLGYYLHHWIKQEQILIQLGENNP